MLVGYRWDADVMMTETQATSKAWQSSKPRRVAIPALQNSIEIDNEQSYYSYMIHKIRSIMVYRRLHYTANKQGRQAHWDGDT